MFRLALTVFIVASVTLPPAPVSIGHRQSRELRVLFIGNSLTSAHDLPRMVERITADGDARIRATAITKNDYSLDDHWADRDAVRAIERGGWSVVVLQQGPSALPESRVQLRAATARLDDVIRRAGARTALYMVWPSLARQGDFDRVRASYQAAAADVGGIFVPAGEAWRMAWRHQPDLALYGPDGFHPTPQASYLAALVLAQVLTGRDATLLPVLMDRPAIAGLPPGRAQLLHDVASETVRATR